MAHPIEEESYRIMASRVDLSRWAEPERHVVARMIHATADESFAETARIGRSAVGEAVKALQAGAVVVCDARMVVAGIPSVAGSVPVRCYLDQVEDRYPDRAGESGAPADTRSARAIELAAAEHPAGALWVIGNAPTALARLIHLYRSGAVEPAAVVGLPVGYVGAAAAKAELWGSGLRAVSVTNRGERGGSPVAAAAVNAIYRMT